MEALLSKRQVLDLVGVSYSTLWSWMRLDGFPKPMRLSSKVIRWRAGEVDRWLKQKSRQEYKEPEPYEQPPRRRVRLSDPF